MVKRALPIRRDSDKISRHVQSSTSGRTAIDGSYQLFVIRPDRPVAFAGAFLQLLGVCDLNYAAGVLDQAGLLQRVSDAGDACPSDPEHLGEIFLREGEIVAS